MVVVGVVLDVFSFGVLLWQMSTGQRPYAGLQAGQVLLGVKTGSLKLQWPAWVNKSLAKVGQACMRFEPKERPGFKGIRSALSKIAARLDQKIAAVELAHGAELGLGSGGGAEIEGVEEDGREGGEGKS
ncbi:putative serine/threonine-protein kinase [Tetrabaena socialis]|uniref:Putative serine/threonine-protein kinase n=1 Tax=Tetrabaena socialis TaxID=47790 RepID=A0A2J7ZPN0_9CHLO|nr:putative serine/threonine-protein kinase [Tetrabaena socialis]|eukprot:PNH02223.1 putative serine/threonine-protein kinase [Tetrabaena socialis]